MGSHNLKIFYLLLILFAILFGMFSGKLTGNVIGENIEVNTRLSVGENYPEIYDLTLSEESVVLIPNNQKRLYCMALLEDFNGENDLSSLSAVLYASGYDSSSPDDKNNHYTSSDCKIVKSFSKFNGVSDDEYHAVANCSFDLESFTNFGEWVCHMEIEDVGGLKSVKEEKFDVMELLALGLPNSIDYGVINSTYVSQEKEIVVTNYGNVRVNLALSGYGSSYGDGYSMKCGLGSGGIPVYYQKYNLVDSTPGTLSLSEFEISYNNLTKNSIVKNYGLDQRKNDDFNEAVDSTYWRIYVPRDVAGTCSGNIMIGAVKG